MVKEFREVPMPEIKEDHWKVGDGLRMLKKGLYIHQIALVLTKLTKTQAEYKIVFYNKEGKPIGDIDGLVKTL